MASCVNPVHPVNELLLSPSALLTAIPRLAKIKGKISVLNHVLELLSHRQAKENDEIHDKYGPENRNIKNGEDRCNQ